MKISDQLVGITREFRDRVDQLTFTSPITHVYNPLNYAWSPHESYLHKYGNSKKEIIFLGMNPGPWGMAQTGIPFGEIPIARDWLRIEGPVEQPKTLHPKRPIAGFKCHRSEVSGKRLWNLFKNTYFSPEKFFARHFVMNYCPLLFYDINGKNITPDKLPSKEKEILTDICDSYLRKVADLLNPKWLVGVGRFAEDRAESALKDTGIQVVRILHPSPANPAANRDFPGQATQLLTDHGIW